MAFFPYGVVKGLAYKHDFTRRDSFNIYLDKIKRDKARQRVEDSKWLAENFEYGKTSNKWDTDEYKKIIEKQSKKIGEYYSSHPEIWVNPSEMLELNVMLKEIIDHPIVQRNDRVAVQYAHFQEALTNKDLTLAEGVAKEKEFQTYFNQIDGSVKEPIFNMPERFDLVGEVVKSVGNLSVAHLSGGKYSIENKIFQNYTNSPTDLDNASKYFLTEHYDKIITKFNKAKEDSTDGTFDELTPEKWIKGIFKNNAKITKENSSKWRPSQKPHDWRYIDWLKKQKIGGFDFWKKDGENEIDEYGSAELMYIDNFISKLADDAINGTGAYRNIYFNGRILRIPYKDGSIININPKSMINLNKKTHTMFKGDDGNYYIKTSIGGDKIEDIVDITFNHLHRELIKIKKDYIEAMKSQDKNKAKTLRDKFNDISSEFQTLAKLKDTSNNIDSTVLNFSYEENYPDYLNNVEKLFGKSIEDEVGMKGYNYAIDVKGTINSNSINNYNGQRAAYFMPKPGVFDSYLGDPETHQPTETTAPVKTETETETPSFGQ